MTRALPATPLVLAAPPLGAAPPIPAEAMAPLSAFAAGVAAGDYDTAAAPIAARPGRAPEKRRAVVANPLVPVQISAAGPAAPDRGGSCGATAGVFDQITAGIRSAPCGLQPAQLTGFRLGAAHAYLAGTAAGPRILFFDGIAGLQP